MVDAKENQPFSFKGDRHRFDDELLKELKKPKDEGEDPDDEAYNQFESSRGKDQENIKLCQVCNKVFGSGKALGGHMRIHVQAYKHLSSSKKKLNAKQRITFKKHKPQQVVDTGKNNVFANKPTCVVCGKNFPSMKSLFGHMRCHPERYWRGVEPPPAAKNSSNSSSVYDGEPENADDYIDSAPANGDCVVDLAESLPKWSVTAKRGHKPISNNASAISIFDEDDHELHQAANHLMLLANEPEQTIKNSGNSNGIKKKRKRMKLRDLENVRDATPVHQMPMKLRVLKHNSINENEKSLANPIMQVEENKESEDNKLVEGTYQCNICKKIFASGQALGGHKRCHWSGPMEATQPGQVIMSSGEVSRIDRRILLDFDLNEAPPMEDDEAGIDY